MKAVLISIRPKWCELIASGKKTIEVRKTRPKIETPFKCYIYCTHDNHKNALHLYVNSGYGRKDIGVIGHWRSGKDVVDVNHHLPAYRYNAYLAEGKVIGEFVCDRIDKFMPDRDYYGLFYDISYDTLRDTCLTTKDLSLYGKGNQLFGLHISELKIYDKPRELSEFTYWLGFISDGATDNHGHLKRPPKSWCYVEEEIEKREFSLDYWLGADLDDCIDMS